MARLSRIHSTRPLPLVAHTLRHPREDENPPHHPSFPRTHEIRNENTTQTSQTHHSHTGLPQCHSREGENDGVFFPGIGGMERWIPAFAGMTDGMDSRLCRNDAYALSRTFFTTICSHRRQSVHLMQGRNAGKKCREKHKEQVQIKKQNCELNRLQLVLPLTESRYHDPKALPSTCK